MSVRKTFRKTAWEVVGKPPAGIRVESHPGGVLLVYQLNSDEQRAWVYRCEELLGNDFKIYVQAV